MTKNKQTWFDQLRESDQKIQENIENDSFNSTPSPSDAEGLKSDGTADSFNITNDTLVDSSSHLAASQSTRQPERIVADSRIRKVLNTVAHIATLIFLPLLFIFYTVKRVNWSPRLKSIAKTVAWIWAPIHAVAVFIGFIMLAYAGGNVNILIDQRGFAERYLEERYHEQFVIGKSMSGDQLGGAVTFSHIAYPVKDKSLTFNVRKCIARCGPGYATDFNDNYPERIWKQQASKEVKEYIKTVDGELTVEAFLNIDSEYLDDVVDEKTGRVAVFDELSEKLRREASYSLYISTVGGSYTFENRNLHANNILQAAKYLQTRNYKTKKINYDVYAKTENTNKGRHQYIFSSSTPESLNSPEDVLPSFRYWAKVNYDALRAGGEISSTKICADGKQTYSIQDLNEMSAHLQQKYGQSFRLLHCTAAQGMGLPDDLAGHEIIAYPNAVKGDKVFFWVEKENLDGVSRYYDSYQSKMWEQQEVLRMQPKIASEDYLVNPLFDIEILPDHSLAGVDANYQFFNTLPVNHRNQLSYHLRVNIYADPAAEIDNSIHRKKIIQLMGELKGASTNSQLTYTIDSQYFSGSGNECRIDSAAINSDNVSIVNGCF